MTSKSLCPMFSPLNSVFNYAHVFSASHFIKECTSKIVRLDRSESMWFYETRLPLICAALSTSMWLEQRCIMPEICASVLGLLILWLKQAELETEGVLFHDVALLCYVMRATCMCACISSVSNIRGGSCNSEIVQICLRWLGFWLITVTGKTNVMAVV